MVANIIELSQDRPAGVNVYTSIFTYNYIYIYIYICIHSKLAPDISVSGVHLAEQSCWLIRTSS